MRKSAAVAGVLAAITGLAACSGGKPDGCLPVSPDVAQAIIDGSKGDLSLYQSSGQAMRAASGVYYVAYKIEAAGSDEVGVWALTEINPPGSIRAVDGFAQGVHAVASPRRRQRL